MFKYLIQLTLKIISNIFTIQFNKIAYILLTKNAFIIFREIDVIKLIKINYFKKIIYIKKKRINNLKYIYNY